jgi:DNA topoisomerase-1
VVHLLESTLIRVGNPQYARSNQSYGLTTLQSEHLEIEGSRIHFEFQGKSGKWVNLDLRDRRAARAVQRCQELPGQALFQFVDGAGVRHRVESSDVNSYLSATAGEEFTAKIFRTWGGSTVAAQTLLEMPAAETKKEAEKNLRETIKTTSQRLRNTPAVCKGHYIHPLIGQAYLAGRLAELCAKGKPLSGLHEEEQALRNLLRAADELS